MHWIVRYLRWIDQFFVHKNIAEPICLADISVLFYAVNIFPIKRFREFYFRFKQFTVIVKLYFKIIKIQNLKKLSTYTQKIK